MSIMVDPYLVARDAIRSMTDITQLNQLSEELRSRHNHIAASTRLSLQVGDQVRYVGTSYACRLVPNVSKGKLVNFGRTRVTVDFEFIGRVRVPVSMIVKIPTEIQDAPAPPEREVEAPPQQPSADDIAWMLEDAG